MKAMLIWKDIYHWYKGLALFTRSAILVTLLICLGGAGLFSQTINIQNYILLEQVTNPKNLCAQAGDFSFYIFDGKLWLIKENANNIDRATRFFLHIRVNNIEELPQNRRESGFDNLDFNYSDSNIKLVWWTGKQASLIAFRKLPKYEIKRITAGQFTSERRLWKKTFECSGNLKNK